MRIKTLLAILPIIAWATPQDVELFAFKPTSNENAYCFVTKSSNSLEFKPYHDKAFTKDQIEEIYIDLTQAKDRLATEKTLLQITQAGFLILIGSLFVQALNPKDSVYYEYIVTAQTPLLFLILPVLLFLQPYQNLIYQLIREHNMKLFLMAPEISKEEMEIRLRDGFWKKFKATWHDTTVFEQILKNLDILSARFKATTPNTDIDCQ
jgi:hypothetical protein